MDNLQECVEAVIRDGVPGDLVETGVWRGGASIFMRAVRRGGARLPRRARHHRAPGGRRRRRGLLAARLTVRAFGGGPRRGGGDGPRPGERPRLPDDPVRHDDAGPALAELLDTFATGLDLAHPIDRFTA
ncbi:TylF/MycF/NovP-related O-methyltransferase, partial [Actinosynnema sp. NPDC047251]